ncbi:MAG: TIGR04086 family membrane protein [Clostridia bacterium]|nr:TIGR04086 family membrane protein [Clostridia bacterium]
MDKLLTKKHLNKGAIMPIFKGVLVAVCASIIGILLFAFILRFVFLSDTAIKIVNQIIKIVSVLFGVMVCVKKDKNKGLLKGALVGGLYTLSSYFLFSLLVASFNFSLTIFYDLIFSMVAGVIFGVLFVNAKR